MGDALAHLIELLVSCQELKPSKKEIVLYLVQPEGGLLGSETLSINKTGHDARVHVRHVPAHEVSKQG